MRSLWESFKLKRKKKMKNEQTSPFKYALDNKILLDHDYLVFSWSKKKSTCWLCVRTSICIQISHDMLMTFYDNDENIQPESDRKIDKVLWHYCSVSHMFLGDDMAFLSEFKTDLLVLRRRMKMTFFCFPVNVFIQE